MPSKSPLRFLLFAGSLIYKGFCSNLNPNFYLIKKVVPFSLLHQIVPKHQHINPALGKRVPGVSWTTHNRLTSQIKAGVHQHRNPGCLTTTIIASRYPTESFETYLSAKIAVSFLVYRLENGCDRWIIRPGPR